MTSDFAKLRRTVSDLANGLDFEVLVENLVVHPDSIVRPAGVVVIHPRSTDVVEMVEPEANELIQTLPFQCVDEGLMGLKIYLSVQDATNFTLSTRIRFCNGIFNATELYSRV